MKDILKTDQLVDVKNRFDYVIRLGAIGLVTGEVGSGKSTTIRYVEGNLNPSEYRSIYITASSGSIMKNGSTKETWMKSSIDSVNC